MYTCTLPTGAVCPSNTKHCLHPLVSTSVPRENKRLTSLLLIFMEYKIHITVVLLHICTCTCPDEATSVVKCWQNIISRSLQVKN